MEINGIGLNATVGLISELGAISQYKSPKQLNKMAGLSLVEDSSGKKKGKRVMSKRGRSNLRKLLISMYCIYAQPQRRISGIVCLLHKKKYQSFNWKRSYRCIDEQVIKSCTCAYYKKVKYDSQKMLNDIK